MAISGDYATPVTVNGYACKNCTDVEYAKKNVDPAHPKDGPFGVNAKDDATAPRGSAVSFGGALAGLAQTPSAPGQPARRVDILA